MNEIALTPAASAAAATTAIQVEVRNLTVTGPDIQSLIRVVECDMEIAQLMEIDSDDLAVELMEMIGRFSTVRSAAEAERKERNAPLLDTKAWLDGGYKPLLDMLDALIAACKLKLTNYSRQVAEAKRIADEAAAAARREEAAEAARKEAAAMAAAAKVIEEAASLRAAGSEQAADTMESEAMVAVDAARQSAAIAVRESHMAPVRAGSKPIKGVSQKWSAEVTDKAKLVAHIGAMIAKGDLTMLSLLDVNEKNLNALARMTMENLALPGVRAVCEDKIAVRKQVVTA